MLKRIREAVRRENYRISNHANEEMANDDLLAVDVERIILTGRIFRRYSRDPRGTRHEIHGQTTDGRKAAVVCRFLPSNILLIITAYALS